MDPEGSRVGSSYARTTRTEATDALPGTGPGSGPICPSPHRGSGRTAPSPGPRGCRRCWVRYGHSGLRSRSRLCARSGSRPTSCSRAMPLSRCASSRSRTSPGRRSGRSWVSAPCGFRSARRRAGPRAPGHCSSYPILDWSCAARVAGSVASTMRRPGALPSPELMVTQLMVLGSRPCGRRCAPASCRTPRRRSTRWPARSWRLRRRGPPRRRRRGAHRTSAAPGRMP